MFNAGSFQEFTNQIIGITVVAGLIIKFKCIRPLQRVRARSQSQEDCINVHLKVLYYDI